MVLKPLLLKGVGIKRHLNIDKLARFGFATDIKADLAIMEVADGRLVEG
jgi:hypothetical protein